MKAEERHRLHEHELRKLTLKAGELWKAHGIKLLAVLVGLAVIVVAVLIWTAGSREAAAEGWKLMAQSGSAEQFTAIAEDYADEPVGHWARLRAAELHLQEGVRQAFSNRGAAVDELEEAVEQFARLLSADLPSDKLHERALYGHARSLETLAALVEPSTGKVNATLDDAIAAYERLLKTFPETIYKPFVEEQIKSLKAERTQQFVAWFRQQQPQPGDRPTPLDGLPGGIAPSLPPGTSPRETEELPFPLPGAADADADQPATPATPESPAAPGTVAPIPQPPTPDSSAPASPSDTSEPATPPAESADPAAPDDQRGADQQP